MKKITSLAILTYMLFMNTTLLADDKTFSAFVYTPSTSDGSLEGYEFDGGGMLGMVFGNKKLFSDSLGSYGSFDMSYNSVDETDSSDAIYGYRIFNLGVTYSPSDSVTLLAGMGISWEYGEMFSRGTHYETEEKEINTNLHIGLAYNVTDKYGAIITYNTASSSMGIGIIGNF